MQTNHVAQPLSDAVAHRPLNRSDYKTLSLAALGGALEFYDFIIYVFFALTIGKVLFPPNMPYWLEQVQVYGIFAAGYLARPLGGIIMAHFGDLFGRKRMFTLSVFLMSMPTLLMGLLPSYASIGLAAPFVLLALRILQGAAIGGEVPGAWVFVSEHVPRQRIGFACGTLTSGLTGGIFLGSLVTWLVSKFFTPQEVIDYAWRLPFILGGMFGIGAMYLRRWLEETPVFLELKQRKELAKELPLLTVARNHRAGVVVSMLLTWVLSAAIVVVILMTPIFLKTIYHFQPAQAQMANLLATITLCVGCIVSGRLADKIGAKPLFMGGALFLGGCAYLLYSMLFTRPELLIPLYMLAGFSVGIVGAVPYVMIHCFEPKVRFSGLSFSYNVAYAIFGGLTPVVVGPLVAKNPMFAAHYIIGVCLLAFVVALFLPRKPMHDRDDIIFKS